MAETTSSANMIETTSPINTLSSIKTITYTNDTNNFYKNIAIASGVLTSINIVLSIIITSYFLRNKYIEIKKIPKAYNMACVLIGFINITTIGLLLLTTKTEDLSYLELIEYKKYKKYYIGCLISSIICLIIIFIINFL